ncbi:Solute carrier family 2, facilitated glucose transporter member 1 [Aphelenchoides fujianensis]|nr:Solute carrier family 2, facilitated glucose transporter member 1 [Aphelenchoides fujianensis]
MTSETDGSKPVVLAPSTDEEQKEKLLNPESGKLINASTDPKQLEGRLTKALLFAVIAATFGSSFQFGYHIGCVNAPGDLITRWYIDSHRYLYNTTLTPEEANVQWSLSVGIFAVGGMIGGLLSGWFADRLGRKGSLLINNLFAFIAAALMSLAKYVGVYYLVTAGRLVIGFSCGLSSGLVPMYLTEIAPTNLRGSLGSVHQLLVTIAILVAQILGLPDLLGNEQRWPLIFAFTVVPCIFQLITLPLCPESPKFNLINKNKPDQAEKDLKKLRDRADVSAEMEVAQAEATAARSQPKVTFGDMFKGALRWPLFIAVMMMFSQQLSGINAAIAAIYATIAMGAINVLMTLVSVYLVDHPKFGRRSLHLTGLIGMCISSILIVVSLSLANVKEGQPPQRPWAAYLSIVWVILFVVAFATGPVCSITSIWFYVARGNANSIAVLANWAANFLVATFFLPLNGLLNQYTFLVFATLLAFFAFFTWKFAPETKNRTLNDIQADMSSKSQ